MSNKKYNTLLLSGNISGFPVTTPIHNVIKQKKMVDGSFYITVEGENNVETGIYLKPKDGESIQVLPQTKRVEQTKGE